MNNKGFTLVELLAIIIIISIIITIVSISVGPIIKKYEKNLSKTQISIIEEAANIYYLKEGIKKSYENRNFKLCVNVEYLIENDYIEDESIKNIYDNEKLEGSIEITYKSDEHTYKYKENSCNYEYEAIDPICTAVTDTTKTAGNIPKGKYLPGDEYICEVKNKTKYHFFVLGTDDDNVNLIMDRNIYYDSTNDVGVVATATNTGLVAWYKSTSDHSYGPVAAMNYLHNATKDWNNIPNMIMNYEDENIDYNIQVKGITGYGSIVTTGTTTIITSKNNTETARIEKLKTRMPRYDEVHGIGKCLTHDENGKKDGSCPLWLVNYMNPYSLYSTTSGKVEIGEIYGYWILSSGASHSGLAWSVDCHGDVGNDEVDDENDNGVRPVISIPKLDIVN